jgi:C4-dicarboxylate transporter, DctM subunit
VPTLNLTALPYLLESHAQGWKLYDTSLWLKAQFEKAPAKGFRFLATWEAGFRNTTTEEALNSPDDAKGKKLRTCPNEMMRWTLETIGSIVIPAMIARGCSRGCSCGFTAAVAAVYGLVMSIFWYRDLRWRRIPQRLLNAFITSTTVMLVIGATGAMVWLITVEQVAQQMAEWVQLVATEPWMFLLPNICLLLLFVAARLTKAGIGEITRHLWLLMAATFTVVLLVTYLPQRSLWLPRLIQSG